jgi:hypothetical protein
VEGPGVRWPEFSVAWFNSYATIIRHPSADIDCARRHKNGVKVAI